MIRALKTTADPPANRGAASPWSKPLGSTPARLAAANRQCAWRRVAKRSRRRWRCPTRADPAASSPRLCCCAGYGPTLRTLKTAADPPADRSAIAVVGAVCDHPALRRRGAPPPRPTPTPTPIPAGDPGRARRGVRRRRRPSEALWGQPPPGPLVLGRGCQFCDSWPRPGRHRQPFACGWTPPPCDGSVRGEQTLEISRARGAIDGRPVDLCFARLAPIARQNLP